MGKLRVTFWWFAGAVGSSCLVGLPPLGAQTLSSPSADVTWVNLEHKAFASKLDEASPFLLPGEQARPDKRILYYLDPPHEQLVMINWGEREGLEEGVLLKSLRPGPLPEQGPPLLLETGQLKVKKVGRDFSVAEVLPQPVALATGVFSEHPGVMAGDVLERPRYLISRKQQVLPEVVMTYHDLFKDPKAQPLTFELSAAGRDKLTALSSVFGDKKLSLLLVKGYTDRQGAAEVNQVESYQRALTVRQFLLEHLGFDEERVVALGFGESAPLDPSNLTRSAEHNRRIALEVVPTAAKYASVRSGTR